MAIVFFDSFDTELTADVSMKWTQIADSPGSTNDASVIGAFGRRSTNGWKAATTTNGMSKSLSITPFMPVPSGARIVIGTAFDPDSAFSTLNTGTDPTVPFSFGGTNVFWEFFITSSRQLWARVNTNGTVSTYRGSTLLGTSSQPLSQSVYQYLEWDILIDNSVGTLDMSIDGANVLHLTGIDTQGAGSAAWNEFRMARVSGGGVQKWYFDDTYLIDASGYTTTLNGAISSTSATSITVTSGAVFPQSGLFRVRVDDELMLVTAISGNTLTVTRGYSFTTAATHSNGATITANCMQGDVRIDAIYPNADGSHSGWTRSTGVSQFATVDETTPNGDTDYNYTVTLFAVDTLNFPNLPVVGANIFAIQLNNYVRKTDAGSAGLKAVARIGGTDYLGTEYSVTSTYRDNRQIWQTKPSDNTMWDETTFNAAEFGYEKTT